MTKREAVDVLAEILSLLRQKDVLLPRHGEALGIAAKALGLQLRLSSVKEILDKLRRDQEAK